MAKTAHIFSSSEDGSTGTLYTVPADHYAIVNIVLRLSAWVYINGIPIQAGNGTSGNLMDVVNGIVCPAGTTIQAKDGPANSMAIASGFLYDN